MIDTPFLPEGLHEVRTKQSFLWFPCVVPWPISLPSNLELVLVSIYLAPPCPNDFFYLL